MQIPKQLTSWRTRLLWGISQFYELHHLPDSVALTAITFYSRHRAQARPFYRLPSCWCMGHFRRYKEALEGIQRLVKRV